MPNIFDPKVAGNKLIKILKTTKRAAILPFIEKPADNRYAPADENKSFEAADLFSLFTASIIKEENVFVR